MLLLPIVDDQFCTKADKKKEMEASWESFLRSMEAFAFQMQSSGSSWRAIDRGRRKYPTRLPATNFTLCTSRRASKLSSTQSNIRTDNV